MGAAYTSQEAMKTVYSSGKVTIPDNCECSIKSRLVQVKGPRGTLTKSFKHMSVDLCKLDDKTIQVEKWFGTSKELAIIKTVCSHIQNLFIGVTKGFEYRMRWCMRTSLPTCRLRATRNPSMLSTSSVKR